MRLERLAITGFKSFSDRAELSFDGGVTAIVGPNGCGKSNVADALTWVLGEQSARSLRGERMEDVIFSGSDARKPTGAAEVTLRLSGVPWPPALRAPGEGGAPGGNGHGGDLDGAPPAATREVEVTRRLYRSGESEYLIDGQQCRLRDIHELLMDTGLGAKAYAIIEQGKIGMILSSRPIDRRQLIEEAAGITKYKARRRAAELKLEAAQQNLTRVDDILSEVDRQRAALKRQAARARRYKRLREELRRWEKVLFARRHADLSRAIEDARARLAAARGEEAHAAARLAGHESALGRLRLALADAEAAAARARTEAHACELDLERRQQQIALDRQHGEMLDRRRAELEAELAALDARRAPEQEAIEARRAAAAGAARAAAEAEAAAAAAASAHAQALREIEAAEEDVERIRQQVYSAMHALAALRAAAEAAGAQRERAAEALARLEVEAADLAAERTRAATAHREAAEARARAQAALEAAQETRAHREAELARAREEHARLVREMRAREQDLAALAARLASLEELEAHRAGYGEGARLVLAGPPAGLVQLGAVADYLETDARYERAVEAWAGERLQYVLVPDHDQARAALDWIRGRDAGRCGFVVVGAPAAPGSAPPEAAERPAGAVRVSEVVRFVGPYREAIAAALGDAWIVETAEAAAGLARPRGVTVVTLDGEVFAGPFLVSGGGKGDGRGILAAKREIKDLQARLAGARAGLERLAAETAGLEQVIATATASVDTLTGALHEHEKAIVSAEAQAQRTAEDEARLARRASLVDDELRRVREEIAGLEARRAEALVAMERLEGDRAAAAAALADRLGRLAEAREAAERLGVEAAESRAAHARLTERSAAAADEVRRLEASAHDLLQRLEAGRRDRQAIEEERERLRAAVAAGERSLDEEVRRLDALREAVRAADEQAAAARAAAEQQDEAIREARRVLDAGRALAADLEVSRARAEAELVHLAQQCADAVQATLEEVAAEVADMEREGLVAPDARALQQAGAPEPGEEEVADAEAAAGEPPSSAGSADAAAGGPMTPEEAIVALKTRIDRLGPVNILAIEQFDELEQRHGFLTTQRQDLADAIAQTNEAIKRIDETTHVRFREAFTAINANFQETFATLFGGGRAGLALLDESDPLESGIDIVASPPGKRLQNVMLLSGGEKALAAIALMFAIFRYKPSPFCVLDEIDAPLDDANIGRFVEMLRGMLDRTQFIIITHNRKTMEIANRLYGVTMEEAGVSKLVSIELN